MSKLYQPPLQRIVQLESAFDDIQNTFLKVAKYKKDLLFDDVALMLESAKILEKAQVIFEKSLDQSTTQDDNLIKLSLSLNQASGSFTSAIHVLFSSNSSLKQSDIARCWVACVMFKTSLDHLSVAIDAANDAHLGSVLS